LPRLLSLLLLFALTVLAACEGEESQTAATPDLGLDAGPVTPDALPLPDTLPPVDGSGNACKPVTPGPAAEIRELKAAPLARYPSLIQVTWKTPTATSGTVRFGLTTALEIAVTAHKAVLRGVPASKTAHFRVEASAGGQCHSATGTAKTGPLPASLPLITLDTNLKGKASSGYRVFPVITQHKSWIVIVDTEGRPVWFHQDTGSVFRARLSLDRKAVLALRETGVWNKKGKILRLPLDGSAATETGFTNAHTDFVEYAPGKYAVLGRSFKSFSNGARKLMGETIVTVDEGGTPKVFWDVFDHITPDLNRNWDKGTYTPDPSVEAWAHLNYLGYDAANKAFMLTSRNLSAALAVSLSTGKTLWILGAGKEATISVGGDGSLVDHPHSAQKVAGGVLVFNNGSLSPGLCSNVTEVAIKGAKVSKAWTYKAPACYQVTFLGEALRLSNGNTLISWSSVGRLDEVSAAKKLVWSLHAALGSGFGYVQHVRSLY